MSRVDVLAVWDSAVKKLTAPAGPDHYTPGMVAARAAIADLIEANRNLTKAVRAFADGEMSNELRSSLFLAASNEPAKESFGLLCTAGDEAEAILARVTGGV